MSLSLHVCLFIDFKALHNILFGSFAMYRGVLLGLLGICLIPIKVLFSLFDFVSSLSLLPGRPAALRSKCANPWRFGDELLGGSVAFCLCTSAPRGGQ